MPIEIPCKVGGQPGGKIAYQSLTRDLHQHPSETVADRKLDARWKGGLIAETKQETRRYFELSAAPARGAGPWPLTIC
jgi:hypothetical protein